MTSIIVVIRLSLLLLSLLFALFPLLHHDLELLVLLLALLIVLLESLLHSIVRLVASSSHLLHCLSDDLLLDFLQCIFNALHRIKVAHALIGPSLSHLNLTPIRWLQCPFINADCGFSGQSGC